jgi:hypothetical protein
MIGNSRNDVMSEIAAKSWGFEFQARPGKNFSAASKSFSRKEHFPIQK